MKIAVCDDDQKVVNQIEALILLENRHSCDGFYNGEELISYLQREEERYSIYFLDIEMPLVNGIDAAAAIRREDKNALIIFITDHKEYVYDVFEVLPFRFLQKPVEKQAFMKALSDAEAHLNTFGQIFFFQQGREQHQLAYSEIRYFESAGRKVIIHGVERDWEIYGKISEIAAELSDSLFCRCHASYIINMDALRSIRKTEAVLKGGETVPVSKRHREELKKAHLSYMERRGGK